MTFLGTATADAARFDSPSFRWSNDTCEWFPRETFPSAAPGPGDEDDDDSDGSVGNIDPEDDEGYDSDEEDDDEEDTLWAAPPSSRPPKRA